MDFGLRIEKAMHLDDHHSELSSNRMCCVVLIMVRAAPASAYEPEPAKQPARLLDGNGLREIARLVYVAASADGDVISEQLQRQIRTASISAR
jgi:hypothetical protein